ncbi:MAG TPA: PspC domain-containing protein [Stackebrandtia sp.]|jgi:signal transduction histidine kinase|uniref:PspC domain-containing protein n=1 Tax=Stackebrandtia sp. TaxID=2023065 RepID=UPI002D3267BE|nr:PspC domain-containing protein [Stackebrandtia sp.]HZE37717.1 PspC domain-containing protein [Stackebrandtia sp.]
MTIDTAQTTATPRPARRAPLRRRSAGRLLTGVARGVAEHLSVKPLYVRLVFLLLATPLFDGLGALLYVALWAVLPSERGDRPWRDRQQWPVFAVLGLGVFIFTMTLGWGGPGLLFGWVLAVVALGAGVIWHLVKPESDWRHSLVGSSGGWNAVLRLGGGGALVCVGVVGSMVIFLGLTDQNYSTIISSVVFTVIALAGVGVVFGPLAWRTITQLRTEREARTREAERADIAAMVHDQVLHTLALIQRRAGDSREVTRLARGQERALRNWLYKPTAAAAEKLGAALEAAAAEIEDSFALTVDAVVVGDCDMDPHLAALVAASREAMVNAAKHAGVAQLSLYAEVEPSLISVFVRDRGSGFDPEAIDDDRHGIRGSIMDRMRRHGGTAEVRSTVGEGTEVRLSMPREEQE